MRQNYRYHIINNTHFRKREIRTGTKISKTVFRPMLRYESENWILSNEIRQAIEHGEAQSATI